MTNRVRRVAELMKHELAEILSKDFEFGGASSPSTRST